MNAYDLLQILSLERRPNYVLPYLYALYFKVLIVLLISALLVVEASVVYLYVNTGEHVTFR